MLPLWVIRPTVIAMSGGHNFYLNSSRNHHDDYHLMLAQMQVVLFNYTSCVNIVIYKQYFWQIIMSQLNLFVSLSSTIYQ